MPGNKIAEQKKAIHRLIADASELKALPPESLTEKTRLVSIYQNILQLNPEQAEAKQGLDEILQNQIGYTQKLIRSGKLKEAPQHIKFISSLSPDSANNLQQEHESALAETTARQQKSSELFQLYAKDI